MGLRRRIGRFGGCSTTVESCSASSYPDGKNLCSNPRRPPQTSLRMRLLPLSSRESFLPILVGRVLETRGLSSGCEGVAVSVLRIRNAMPLEGEVLGKLRAWQCILAVIARPVRPLFFGVALPFLSQDGCVVRLCPPHSWPFALS